MKRKNPERLPEESDGGLTDEAALLEEIRQLRAALRIYRELVERLMQERKQSKQ